MLAVWPSELHKLLAVILDTDGNIKKTMAIESLTSSPYNYHHYKARFWA